MKRELFFVLGTLTAAIASTALGKGGVESSGGAEFNTSSPAWFLSLDANAKIRTCTLISPEFGVDQTTAESALRLAFKKWGDYMIKKRVQTLPYNYIGTHSIYITALDLLPKCDGREDLRVYFGAKDEQVLAARSKYTKPYGFIHSTAASTESTSTPPSTWGRGFIYISTSQEIAPAAPWTTPGHLLGILLQEVGHILGNSHLDGTIMDSAIGDDLLFPTWGGGSKHLENIDIRRELRVCDECGTTYEGELIYGNTYSADKALETLTGLKSAWVRSVKFVKKEKLRPDGSHPKDYNLPEGELIFSDDGKETSFHLKSISSVAFNMIEVPLFARKDGWSYSYGNTYVGMITDAKGTALPIIVNLNSNGFAFEIQLMDGKHYPQKLFISKSISN